MNFVEALKKMDKLKSPRTYIRLLCNFDDECTVEYTCRRNPCWLADLLFFEQGKELTRLPASLFISDKWELCALSEIINIESYTGENCKKCGRCRVELITLSSGNKYHICEKCRYIEEQDRYCDDSDFSYDVYSNHKTYLNEVIRGVIKK